MSIHLTIAIIIAAILVLAAGAVVLAGVMKSASIADDEIERLTDEDNQQL